MEGGFDSSWPGGFVEFAFPLRGGVVEFDVGDEESDDDLTDGIKVLFTSFGAGMHVSKQIFVFRRELMH